MNQDRTSLYVSPAPLDPNAVEDYVRMTRIIGEVFRPIQKDSSIQQSDEEIEEYFSSSLDDEQKKAGGKASKDKEESSSTPKHPTKAGIIAPVPKRARTAHPRRTAPKDIARPSVVEEHSIQPVDSKETIDEVCTQTSVAN